MAIRILPTKNPSQKTRILAKAAKMKDVPVFRSVAEAALFVQGASTLVSRLETDFRLVNRELQSAAQSFKINRSGGGAANLTNKPAGKVDKINLKNIKGLIRHNTLIGEAHDKHDALESLEAQINHLFSSESESANLLKGIASMKERLVKMFGESHSEVQRIAKENEPKEFRDICAAILKQVTSKLEGRYKTLKVSDYLSTVKPANDLHLRFTKYAQFTSLESDEGHTYPNYYIVFTGDVTAASDLEMHVNVLTRMLPPDKFHIGHSFETTKEGYAILSAAMEIEDFSSLLEPSKLPFTKDQVDFTKIKASGLIADTEVNEDSVEVLFNSKVTADNVDKVIERVFLDLRKITGFSTRSRVKYKKEKKGRLFNVSFFIIPPEHDSIQRMKLNNDKLRQMKDYLGLDDIDVKRIHQIMNKGH